MATLSVQQITLAGTVTSYASAAGGGDKCLPGENTFIGVFNGGASPITVTVDSVRNSDQGTDEDLVVTVANGVQKYIGPLKPNRFANASDGLVSWTYSGVSSVTVAAVSI